MTVNAWQFPYRWRGNLKLQKNAENTIDRICGQWGNFIENGNEKGQLWLESERDSFNFCNTMRKEGLEYLVLIGHE